MNPKLKIDFDTEVDLDSRGFPSVFILNLAYTGLGIARSFAETGIKVFGIGSKRWACGNYSRYVNFFHSPDSQAEPERLSQFLIALAQRETQKPVIFPTRDHDILFLNRYREKLEPYFIIALPEKNTLNTVMDKWKLFEAAKRCNVTTPKTYVIGREDELGSISSQIDYPVIIKPLRAADWRKDRIWKIVKRKAIYCPSEKTLWREYNRFKHINPTVLLQEYIEGADDDIYTFCSYCDRHSHVLVSFNTRKRIQRPERFGTGIVVQSAVNNEITECSKRLLKFIGFTGTSEIEYKRDPATGIYYLIEINPRFWDQHRLSGSFGINLPLVAYSDLTGKGRPPSSSSKYQPATWIAEDGFIKHFTSELFTRRKKPGDILHKLGGNINYAVWDRKDPLPFLISLALMITDMSKQVTQRISSWVE
ncbi:MAG: ATP-grasp domain-containing protein [bacterium]